MWQAAAELAREGSAASGCGGPAPPPRPQHAGGQGSGGHPLARQASPFPGHRPPAHRGRQGAQGQRHASRRRSAAEGRGCPGAALTPGPGSAREGAQGACRSGEGRPRAEGALKRQPQSDLPEGFCGEPRPGPASPRRRERGARAPPRNKRGGGRKKGWVPPR